MKTLTSLFFLPLLVSAVLAQSPSPSPSPSPLPGFSRVRMGGAWTAAENTQANVYRSGGVQQGGRVGNLGAAYYESASIAGTGNETNTSLSISNFYFSTSGGLSLEWWLTPYVNSSSGYVKMTKGLPALGPYLKAPSSYTNVSVSGEARVTWRTGFNAIIACQYASFPATNPLAWWTGAKTNLPGAAYYDN